MSRRRCASLLVALACVATATQAAAPAVAEFEPIRLVSRTPAEQADVASAPAISADGRYVAFEGVIAGQRGIFRADLRGGGMRPVLAGDAYDFAAPGADASGPSISADGRYVSFTTSTSLDPASDRGASDVYVADLATSPPSYELASTLDGCDPTASTPEAPCGLTYYGGDGARAADRVAISADGRRVAFIIRGESNLTSERGGSTEGVPTPAGQVAVRDLDANRTILISAGRDPISGAMTDLPVPGGAAFTDSLPLLAGASISADGSTVAWIGVNLSAQAPLLSDEAQRLQLLEIEGYPTPYDEPLWRRLPTPAQPAPPTRRVLGGGDPLAAGCAPGGTLSDLACQGPFPGLAGIEFIGANATGWLAFAGIVGVPRLSADGRAVLLVGTPPPSGVANLYLVDMGDGLSRLQALRTLTREVPLAPGQVPLGPDTVSGAGMVLDAAISADGRRVALATARREFPLSPPRLVGQPPSPQGLVEIYWIDLDQETLERVTAGPTAAPSLGPGGLGGAEAASRGLGAAAPSLSADGGTIAFASTAANLVASDANAESDVFTTTERLDLDEPGAVEVSPPPPPVTVKSRRRISLSGVSLPDGTVRLRAQVPGPGALRARARALSGLLVSGGGQAGPAIASAGARARAAGTLILTLPLPPRLRRRARAPGGLAATVRASFHGPGGATLHDELEVRFRIGRGRR